jgi:hypothetical protein
MQTKLTFREGNAKLRRGIYTFSLPAGYTCPGAKHCLARAQKATGKLTDGPSIQFRCFAASQEAVYPTVRAARWRNLEALQGLDVGGITRAIIDSLPAKAKMVRIHVSGDFYSQNYFDAWLKVAQMRRDVTFYAYTKSLPFWVARLAEIPLNLLLTASRGGMHDQLIAEHGLREAVVVYSVEEAAACGLAIDHDDSHAYSPGGSFALLIHGVQPAGSPAAQSIRILKEKGVTYGYSA